MIYHEYHLDFMLSFRESTRKIHTLSATKTRLFNELKEKGLMKLDDQGFIYNSELGDTVIDVTLRHFNEFISLMKA